MLDEDGLLVVGQVRQELTKGLGRVQLVHWLHYSHHVNLGRLAQALLNPEMKCQIYCIIELESYLKSIVCTEGNMTIPKNSICE